MHWNWERSEAWGEVFYVHTKSFALKIQLEWDINFYAKGLFLLSFFERKPARREAAAIEKLFRTLGWACEKKFNNLLSRTAWEALDSSALTTASISSAPAFCPLFDSIYLSDWFFKQLLVIKGICRFAKSFPFLFKTLFHSGLHKKNFCY